MGDDFTRAKFQWLDAIARDPDITAFTFRTAYVIAGHFSRKEGGKAWPSHDKLAKELRASPAGVKKALSALQESYLDIASGKPWGRSNYYRMKAPFYEPSRGSYGGSHPHPEPHAEVATAVAAGSYRQHRGSHAHNYGSPQPSLQNPSTKPFVEPLKESFDGNHNHKPPRSLTTALEEGTFARSPSTESTERKRAVRSSGNLNGRECKRPKAQADRGKYEIRLSQVVGGLQQLCDLSLSDEHMNELCEILRQQPEPAASSAVLARLQEWQGK